MILFIIGALFLTVASSQNKELTPHTTKEIVERGINK